MAPIYTRAVAELQAEVELLTERVEDVEGELRAHKESIDLLLGRSLAPYIVSRGGHGTYHCVRGDYNLIPPNLWRTACGWRYSVADYVRAETLPKIGVVDRFCDKCFPASLRDDLIKSYR